MLFSGIIAALTSLLIPIIILLLLLPNACYVVEQQHAVIIERLGKFNRIVNAGFHVKVPVIDRKAATVSLRTMKNGFGIDVKTQDNVTIGLESPLSTRELRHGRRPGRFGHLQELLHAAGARRPDARLHHRRPALLHPRLHTR